MSFQKKLLFNSVLAFSTIVVALVAIYNFKLANEKTAMIGAFEEEKILLEAQVNEIILHIDCLKKENDWLKNENNYLLEVLFIDNITISDCYIILSIELKQLAKIE